MKKFRLTEAGCASFFGGRKINAKILGLVAALTLGPYGAASATTINGVLNILALQPTINAFDPAVGHVPAGYGNSSSWMAVLVGPGVEFGFGGGQHTDTADFNPTSLVVQDLCNHGYCPNTTPWRMTFTASTLSFFSGLNLTADTFPNGVTYSVLNDTLTVNWGGGPLSVCPVSC